MNILVTGTGRSGTTYTTAVLKKLGIRVNHEKMGPDGTCSWRLPYNKPYYRVPVNRYPVSGLSGFTHIFHQVRNPLDSIASMHTITKRSWEYICYTESKISMSAMNDSLLLRCMKYWLYWNIQCYSISLFTYRIESFNFLDITNVLGVTPTDEQIQDAIEVDHDVNSREHEDITYNDLVCEDADMALDIKELAEKYGYSDISDEFYTCN